MKQRFAKFIYDKVIVPYVDIPKLEGKITNKMKTKKFWRFSGNESKYLNGLFTNLTLIG